MPTPKKQKKVRKVEGWAEVGSHGGIFEFVGGDLGESFKHLMCIYSKKVTSDLIKVEIICRP